MVRIGVRLGCTSNTSGTFTIKSWSNISTSGSYLSKAPIPLEDPLEDPLKEYIDLT